MASTSSTTHWKYDVFLSFRGADTRDNFTSHLHAALCNNQINTFMDDKDIDGGEEISPAILKAIEESNISIVVFSKTFADSPWCLDELEKILECKEKFGQNVLPVFYHVDPTDIQELKGSFGHALVKHEQQFSINKVESWSHGLHKISNLKGWNSHDIKPESKLIQKIVNDISKKLKGMSSSTFNELGNFDTWYRQNQRVNLILPENEDLGEDDFDDSDDSFDDDDFDDDSDDSFDDDGPQGSSIMMNVQGKNFSKKFEKNNKKEKFYVVFRGIRPGIYRNWHECAVNVIGVSQSLYQAYDTMDEAVKAYYM